jgi:hypothetical protein
MTCRARFAGEDVVAIVAVIDNGGIEMYCPLFADGRRGAVTEYLANAKAYVERDQRLELLAWDWLDVGDDRALVARRVRRLSADELERLAGGE